MAILLPIIILLIMLMVVALLMPYGLWGNAINLINVVTAALLATNFWEPASSWLTGKIPGDVLKRYLRPLDIVRRHSVRLALCDRLPRA